MFQRVRFALMLMMCVYGAHGQTTTPAAPATAPLPAPIPSATAPSPAPPAALSPAEVYKQSMRPLDQVRASLDNWSDPELGALSIGIGKAREACTQMDSQAYTGDDLYDYAHLCAFGQVWGSANTAAAHYIASNAQPHRAQAYALNANALLQMGQFDQTAQTAQEMLNALPYDAEAAFTLRYMKDSLEQRGAFQALHLAEDEHEKIIAALQQGPPLKSATGDGVMSIGELYDSAMQLAFFYENMGNSIAGSAIVASCDAALPDAATLAPEDRQRIENVRTRFHLLGKHLPDLTITRSLASSTAKPRLPESFGAGTVFVLFPDWCVQCRKMMKTLTEFANVNADTPLHAYGLVFADTSMITDTAVHEGFLQELQGTSTLVVPAATTQTFGAQEFPLAIVVDSAGLVRFIGPIPPDAFNGDGYITKVIHRMIASGPVGKAIIHIQKP
jgi:tetratricopeptide (TPR) repeat protein